MLYQLILGGIIIVNIALLVPMSFSIPSFCMGSHSRTMILSRYRSTTS